MTTTRRRLLGLLASAAAFLGFARKGDAAYIISAPDAYFVPKGVYALAGEIITCENGHPICEFVKTVETGAIQNVAEQIGKWRQKAPTVGDFPIPGCAICGAEWTDGQTYHIAGAWRDPYGFHQRLVEWRKSSPPTGHPQ